LLVALRVGDAVEVQSQLFLLRCTRGFVVVVGAKDIAEDVQAFRAVAVPCEIWKELGDRALSVLDAVEECEDVLAGSCRHGARAQ